MRQKTGNLLLCALFCAFLLGMLLLFLLLPRQDFSPREKRFLAQAPRLRAEEVFSGRFGREAESWCADHLPGRDFFVGLNARALYWSNLQVTRPVYPGRSGRLYEAPAAYDEAVIARNMDAINAFARDLGQELDLMLVPSAGFVLQEDLAGLADPYPDDRIIARAGALAGEQVQLVDLLPLFRAHGSSLDQPGRLAGRRGLCRPGRALSPPGGGLSDHPGGGLSGQHLRPGLLLGPAGGEPGALGQRRAVSGALLRPGRER